MFLEPSLFFERVVVCPFDSWRTKAAQAMRDEARAAGKTPIRAEHMDSVMAARDVFLSNSFTKNAFAGGVFEHSLFWKHPLYGFWCRCRPDFLADSRSHICDYKATANADPNKFGKHAYDMGYHRSAAWYLDGCRAVLGAEPSHYWFVNQEVKRPYLISVTELDQESIQAGRIENDKASAIFARCLESGDWHGYRHPEDPSRDLAFRVSLPNWAYTQIDTRI
jgi:hypothetical protein